MNSNEMSRYLRWAIPGWIAIVSCVIFIIADILSTQSGHLYLFGSITDFIQILSAKEIFANAFLVTIAGIPLGFVIYQFYFFIRWNSPFSKDGLFPPLIQGRLQDLDNTIRNIGKDQLSFNGIEWRKAWLCPPAYDNDHQFRWQYIESLLTEIFQKLDTKYSGLKLHERHRYLIEMMHTLGASLVGVYLGFLTYLILKVRYETLPITSYAVAITTGVFILVFALDQEDKEHHMLQGLPRRQRSDRIYKFLETVVNKIYPKGFLPNPSIWLGIFSGMIIFFVSPSILANQQFPLSWDYLWRLICVTLAIFIIWLLGAQNVKERWGICGYSVIIFVCCFLMRQSRDSFTWIDWSFTGPFFIFMTMNLVLLKNRQNNRDDLIAFENYTLNRYLMEEQGLYVEKSDKFEINYSYSWPHRMICPGNQEASLTRPENTK